MSDQIFMDSWRCWKAFVPQGAVVRQHFAANVVRPQKAPNNVNHCRNDGKKNVLSKSILVSGCTPSIYEGKVRRTASREYLLLRWTPKKPNMAMTEPLSVRVNKLFNSDSRTCTVSTMQKYLLSTLVDMMKCHTKYWRWQPGKPNRRQMENGFGLASSVDFSLLSDISGSVPARVPDLPHIQILASPISDLATQTRHVSSEGDYSIRFGEYVLQWQERSSRSSRLSTVPRCSHS